MTTLFQPLDSLRRRSYHVFLRALRECTLRYVCSNIVALNSVRYNIPLDVTLIPVDVTRIFYIYRNIIRAIRCKNQSYPFHKTYACVENKVPDFSKKKKNS